MTEFLSLEALAARIPDGSLLAIPPDHVGVAMAATRALLRRGVRHLRLLTVPTSGLQADLLIGAGAVAEIETAGVMLGEAGAAGRFTAAPPVPPSMPGCRRRRRASPSCPCAAFWAAI